MTDNIESLQEIIRIYGQHDAPPSTEIIQLFIDMGFDEVSAREALRIAGNHHSLACEWLVGNRTKTIREHYNGLPIDSPVLNSLLNSPHIQLSLSSPKTLFGTHLFFLFLLPISLTKFTVSCSLIAYV